MRKGAVKDRRSVSGNVLPGFSVQDCAFLALAVALSSVLYVPHLGSYSDDWNFLRIFHFSEDQSLPGLIRSFFLTHPNTLARPVQALYFAVLFRLFELNPTGYHAINTAVLLSGLCVLYFVLRALTENRLIALAITLVYGLLPHYSTDRFWNAGSQANLSMALSFFSLYCDLRLLTSKGLAIWGWKAAALLGLTASALAYEIFMPLLLLSPLLIAFKWRELRASGSEVIPSRPELALACLSTPAVLVLIVIYKTGVSSRAGSVGWWVICDGLRSYVELTFGAYGVGLPHVLLTIARNYWNWWVSLSTLLLVIMISWYLARVTRQSNAQLPRASVLAMLALAGMAVTGISYGYFYSYFGVNTGINNRVAIAAAIGVAFSLVAVAGALSRVVCFRRRVNHFFDVSIALVCGCGCLINNSIASFWIDASYKQQEILGDMARHFSTLPQGSAVMLDGFCPWIGPGIVFETDWDVSGALALLYRDNTIAGDVVRPWMKVTEQGIQQKREGKVYSFASLYFYDVRRKESHRIADAGSALHYLAESAREDTDGCLANYRAFGAGLPIW